MRRLATLICTLLISVMLWSGTAARAAELAACIEVTSEAPGHFDGDDDEVPSDPDKGTPHHHGTCNGHSVAVPIEGDGVAYQPQRTQSLGRLSAEFLSGCDPGTTLRPPIA